MEKQHDGPQVSTRHAKDRRPSYNTKSARAVASLEQRLAVLEGRLQQTSQHSSPPKCNAALDIDADLKEFGQMFNTHEKNIMDLESAGDCIEERLTKLETAGESIDERLRPYDDYHAKAMDAVKQLTDLQTRVKSSSPSKADSGLSTLANEHEAGLREFSGRLLRVEDHSELMKAQPLSTRDLALALTQRLSRGDLLLPDIADQLRQALNGGHDVTEERPITVVRQQETPVTDDCGAELPTQDSSVEENGSPRKRRRTEQPVSSKKKPKAATFQPEPISTPEVESALSSFKSGGLADTEADEDNDDAADAEHFQIPPEVRRTSRQPMPTKQHPDFVHWRDANKRVKSIRPSAASPRKSAG